MDVYVHRVCTEDTYKCISIITVPATICEQSKVCRLDMYDQYQPYTHISISTTTSSYYSYYKLNRNDPIPEHGRCKPCGAPLRFKLIIDPSSSQPQFVFIATCSPQSNTTPHAATHAKYPSPIGNKHQISIYPHSRDRPPTGCNRLVVLLLGLPPSCLSPYATHDSSAFRTDISCFSSLLSRPPLASSAIAYPLAADNRDGLPQAAAWYG